MYYSEDFMDKILFKIETLRHKHNMGENTQAQENKEPAQCPWWGKGGVGIHTQAVWLLSPSVNL